MNILLRRTLRLPLLLAGVTAASLLLPGLAPGDPYDDLRLAPGVSAEAIEVLRVRHGLGEPFWQRYGRWLASAARGEFGRSAVYGLPVSDLLKSHVPKTLALVLPALAAAWMLAALGGLWSGLSKRTRRPLESAAVALAAVPDVVLALGAVVLALSLGVFPYTGPGSAVLPAAVVALAILPHPLRHSVSGFTAALDTSWLRAARAHGIDGLRLMRLAWPLAATEMASLLGPTVASALGASVVVEVVFAWPGLGALLVEAAVARDADVVTGAVLAATLILALANLAGDLLLLRADPRMALQ